MITVICMLLPAVFSLAIWERITENKTTNYLDYFKKLILYTFAVNVMMLFTLILIGWGDIRLMEEFTPFFIIKYLLGAGIYACLLPMIANKLKKMSLKNSPDRVEKHKFIYYLIGSILMFLGLLVISATFWALRTFGNITFDKVVFTLTTPMKGTASNIIFSYLLTGLLPPIIIMGVVLLCMFVLFKKPRTVNLKIMKHQFTFYNFPRNQMKRYFAFVSILVFAGCIGYSVYRMDVIPYIEYMVNDSTFIQEAYVDPRNVEITFPEEKQNLIYIYLESMESSYTSKEYGGVMDDDLIPNLRKIANENTHFSNSDALGGARGLPYTDYTMAGMTAQHGGLPLKVQLQDKNDYSEFATFLPGLYSLGEILEEQGYNQMAMMGSDAEFGGRENFYKQHGNYEIKDLFTAREDGYIDEDYYVWWGFEDLYLYQYAKDEITKLAAQDEPFNFTMLTVDTHFEAGYVCDLCGTDHSHQYDNVIQCADNQIGEFIEWIQEQDFYDNTTVVLVGDHLTMDVGWSQRIALSDYTRTIYNASLNPRASSDNTNDRQFSAFDMYPTTIAALGAEIKGDKLGLGVNLFSNKQTILERHDPEWVADQINYRSKFYNEQILK